MLNFLLKLFIFALCLVDECQYLNAGFSYRYSKLNDDQITIIDFNVNTIGEKKGWSLVGFNKFQVH